MRFLVLLGLLAGCTASPPPPAPPPLETVDSLDGWSIVPQARPARLERIPAGLRLNRLPGGPSWGTKAVKDYGVEDTSTLSHLLVHLGPVEGSVTLNWKLKGWGNRNSSDIVLGSLATGPALFDLKSLSPPPGKYFQELGLRLRGKSAVLIHAEWIRAVPPASGLAAAHCRYLVFDFPAEAGAWEVRLGNRRLAGKGARREALVADGSPTASFKGSPRIFQWAGCPQVPSSTPNGES